MPSAEEPAKVQEASMLFLFLVALSYLTNFAEYPPPYPSVQWVYLVESAVLYSPYAVSTLVYVLVAKAACPVSAVSLSAARSIAFYSSVDLAVIAVSLAVVAAVSKVYIDALSVVCSSTAACNVATMVA